MVSINKKNATKWYWFFAFLLMASLAAAYAWRGPIVCGLFYPECSPFIEVAAMPNWKIPTNPHEREMYDLAHSLKLPESVAKPVPFDFKAARIKDIYGDKSVAQQYFEHLCETESRDYIFERIPNVNGFQIMRPRPPTIDTPEDKDRFGTEEPVGFGWYNDDNQLDPKGFVAGNYIQPLNGFYTFVEYINPAKPAQVVRIERASAPVDPEKYPYGIEANWRLPAGDPIRVPVLKAWRFSESVTSRYGYIWRGLRRPRDREFGVAGGEFIVFDIQTKKVLGFRRSFNSTYVPYSPNVTRWSAARECEVPNTTLPIPNFIKRVLNVDIHVNDQYVPPEYLDQYHEYMKIKMEAGYAR
jgi:hypothetical protein